MRAQAPSYQEVAVPPGPWLRLAPAVGRFLPVGARSRETRSWLAPLLLIAVVGVGGGVVAGGLPAGSAGPATVGLLAVAAALSIAGLSAWGSDLRGAVPGSTCWRTDRAT